MDDVDLDELLDKLGEEWIDETTKYRLITLMRMRDPSFRVDVSGAGTALDESALTVTEPSDAVGANSLRETPSDSLRHSLEEMIRLVREEFRLKLLYEQHREMDLADAQMAKMFDGVRRFNSSPSAVLNVVKKLMECRQEEKITSEQFEWGMNHLQSLLEEQNRAYLFASNGSALSPSELAAATGEDAFRRSRKLPFACLPSSDPRVTYNAGRNSMADSVSPRDAERHDDYGAVPPEYHPSDSPQRVYWEKGENRFGSTMFRPVKMNKRSNPYRFE